MLASWLHTLDPTILHLTETFAIRWYGIAYLAGFAAAFFIMRGLARRGLFHVPPERVMDAMVWLMAGALIGGRLTYVFIYNPKQLWSFSGDFPYWGVLAINNGGMASHGGILGTIIAVWWVAKSLGRTPSTLPGEPPRKGCSPMHAMDVLALASAPGLFFGRLANFVNGELLGRIVTPPGVEGPWWTVQYPQELLGWLGRGVHEKNTPDLSPAQEAQFWSLVDSVRRPGDSLHGAIARVVDHASAHAQELKPLLSSRHASQLYQAAAEGLAVGIVTWLVFRSARKPGVVGSVWLITYGVLRIVTEFWRLPDAQFAEGRPMGLSRGQWLSAAMVGAGVVSLIWCSRRTAAKLRGWGGGGSNPVEMKA